MSRQVRVAFMDVPAKAMPEGIGVLSVQATRSMLDFDVVVWNMTACLSYPVAQGMTVDHPLVDIEHSRKLISSRARCEKEVAEFLNSGRTLVVMLPKPVTRTLTIHDGGNYSYPFVGVMSFLPKDARGSTVDSSGSEFEFRGLPSLEPFWKRVEDISEFQAYFENPAGTPYLFVKGTSRVVGSVVDCLGGTVVYIPHLRHAKSIEEHKVLLATLGEAVGELPALLGRKRASIPMPDWISDYRLPKEADMEKAVAESRRVLDAARADVDVKEETLATVQRRKLLLYGTGLPLQEQVIAAFNVMGVKAESGPEGMEDVVLRYSDMLGVAEVFGATGSASLKKALQVMHWVERYHEEHNEDPKGFYIVNAYRETAPPERTEPAFPDNVVRYCKKREYCLVTTVQLLCILLDVTANPSRAETVLSELWSTVGVYKGRSDVAAFLESR